MKYKFDIGEKVKLTESNGWGYIVNRRFALMSFKHKTFWPTRYYTVNINAVVGERIAVDYENETTDSFIREIKFSYPIEMPEKRLEQKVSDSDEGGDNIYIEPWKPIPPFPSRLILHSRKSFYDN